MNQYRMDQYGAKPSFASFLPGIAGTRGIPIWCYYVNRGQGVVSFGVSDKDHPIMEFLPAHRAYTRVGQTGFRTFLRVTEPDGGENLFAEAFSHDDEAAMEIGMNMLSLEDLVKGSLGGRQVSIRVRVCYFVLPEEPLGALVRRVELINESEIPIHMEVLDGMPELVCYGVTDWTLKNMLQTGKAWMQAEDSETGVPYFRVRASMEDTADVSMVEGGNFALGLSPEGERLKVLTDPEAIFDYDLSLGCPRVFIENGLAGVYEKKQHFSNLFPCAFFGEEGTLKAGESLYLDEMIGQAGNKTILSAFLEKTLDKTWFDSKQQAASDLCLQLTDCIDTSTADPIFDAYARYTYMDNVLRGGKPVSVGGKNLYVYSRKHGDLERDYNYFSMLPEYYSQGNGAYRDVNQNRRSDTFFTPAVGKTNIRNFFELIQIDGYNPLSVDMQVFELKPEQAEEFGKENPGLEAFLQKPFTPGRLLEKLLEFSDENRAGQLLELILEASTETVQAHFGEGYWCDHWTYNLDLIQEYMEIWPDRAAALFLTPEYGYYQASTMVLPRKKRYAKTKNGIRQYSYLLQGDALLEKTGGEVIPDGQRLKDWHGAVVKSTLLEKLILLCAVKFAALDPYGMGIEMEGGKPGWYDALNGLPGLLGSSMAETYELLRLTEFTLGLLKNVKEVSLLKEVSDLIGDIGNVISAHFSEAGGEGEKFMPLWNGLNEAKERYREKTFPRVSGERTLYSEAAEENVDSLQKRLALMRNVLTESCAKAEKTGVSDGEPLDCPTYFFYEALSFEEDQEGIMPTAFQVHTMPAFLEGPVHRMKLGPALNQPEKLYAEVKSSSLYDQKLGMYRVNASLESASYEVGRCRAFTPGWLENGSIWLHMEYKYLLELLKAGLYEEFFADLHQAAIPFLDPAVYGRSPLENSSFLASSLNPNESFHGRGFVARLSGSTAEFLSIWRRMFFGERMFGLDQGKLFFEFAPAIPEYLVPEDKTISAMLLGHVKVTYHLSAKADVIPGRYQITRALIRMNNGQCLELHSGKLGPAAAENLRNGLIQSIELEVEN